MSHSVQGMNDCRGVLQSWDGTTPGVSLCPWMKRLQGSRSVLGWNDSRGVLLSLNGTTPGESSVLGRNESRDVLLSCDGTTPGESFCPVIERLQCSHSVLG